MVARWVCWKAEWLVEQKAVLWGEMMAVMLALRIVEWMARS